MDAQMRRAQMHADGVSQRRRWARKLRGPKFMWTAFADVAVDAQMRRVHIHVDKVLRKRRRRRKCGGAKFMWAVFG